VFRKHPARIWDGDARLPGLALRIGGRAEGAVNLARVFAGKAQDFGFQGLGVSHVVRERTSTALHALAPETPTAKSKAHGHTDFGEAGP